MRDELMDKGMEPEDAFDKACDKYGFDPDDVSEYMDKKNEATTEASTKLNLTSIVIVTKITRCRYN